MVDRTSLPTGCRPPRYTHRTEAAIAGTIVVAVMLGAGKWGAHLSIGPIYLGDLLLLFAIFHAVASWIVVGPRTLSGVAARPFPGYLIGLLLAFVLWRFAVGREQGLVALRDFAPFAYCAITFLSASSFARSAEAGRARTMRILTWALLFHLVWVTGSFALKGIYGGGTGTEIFALRFDTDGTVLGITAGLFLMRFLRRVRRFDSLVIAAWSLGVMTAMTSRAALIASAAVVLMTAGYYLLSERKAEKRMLIVGVIPLVLSLLLVVAPSTTAGSKLLATIGVTPATTRVEMGGLGTAQARSNAWGRVIDYTGQESPITGVGFGPHFMNDSGANILLLAGDSDTVRSPHNWFVGTFARLGVIGLVLTGTLILLLFVEAWRVRHVAGTNEIVFFAAITVVATTLAAAFGVVLEAPFGAIPFFWAAGILLTRPAMPSFPFTLPLGARRPTFNSPVAKPLLGPGTGELVGRRRPGRGLGRGVPTSPGSGGSGLR